MTVSLTSSKGCGLTSNGAPTLNNTAYSEGDNLSYPGGGIFARSLQIVTVFCLSFLLCGMHFGICFIVCKSSTQTLTLSLSFSLSLPLYTKAALDLLNPGLFLIKNSGIHI